MIDPVDHGERARFIGELERNFSVVAAAGSGKTRAITDRIVALARHPRALEWLPKLLVVTYTNRAATEMQQRARQSIIEAALRPEVLVAFNRAFFGTIHSLCTRLLRQHGHHLGLRGQLEHLDETQDAVLWTEFLQHQNTLGGTLEAGPRRTLLRLIPARKLMDLGRHGHAPDEAPLPGIFPSFDFQEIRAFVPNSKGSLPAVNRCREALDRWEKAWARGGYAGPLPACESKPLRAAWDPAVAALRAWVQRASLHVAADTARRYREFRLRQGAMTYGDQVLLAAALLRHPDASARIRSKGYRVILDEAQDTDPTQFDVLLQIARPPEAPGDWLDEKTSPPRPGHFCMVGDFQQSIFGARADLVHYRRVHQLLCETGAGEALEFSVTFRLDEASLHFVNAALPAVLHGTDQQVDFVRLNPRPGHSRRTSRAPRPGRSAAGVARLERLAESSLGGGATGRLVAAGRVGQAAGVLVERGGAALPAHSLAAHARRGVTPGRTVRPGAIRAGDQRDNPAHAWFTALVVALAQPRSSYEIVGVLREIFGISDQDLANFAGGKRHRFQIAAPTRQGGPVGETLQLLATLREEAATLPLFTTMQKMVEVTHLRERLRALPAEDFEGLEKDLENLLTRTATAEAEGATLATLAMDLTTEFGGLRDVRATNSEAVQIISGHKAKGSEWDAVIVPYFARQVSVKTPGYPRLLRHPHTREHLAALDSGDVNDDLKNALDTQARQELERVLYVALTRARHTLVLVDDRPLFCGKSGLPKNAQAGLLRCAAKDTQATIFEALPDALALCAATGASRRPRPPGAGTERDGPPSRFAPRPRSKSAGNARRFSSNAIPAPWPRPPPPRRDPTAFSGGGGRPLAGPNAGQRYGTWWHEFMELLDWPTGVPAWDAAFERSLAASPDPDRSRREWSLLRNALTDGSDLGRLLTKPGALAHAELPFLWAMNGTECLDGIIDLAVLDPATGGWLILDWKTNRQTEQELPGLRDHYRPQLSAYWQAVGNMVGAPVNAGIYSTPTGRWLPYAEEELAASWDRLRAAPDELERVLGEP